MESWQKQLYHGFTLAVTVTICASLMSVPALSVPGLKTLMNTVEVCPWRWSSGQKSVLSSFWGQNKKITKPIPYLCLSPLSLEESPWESPTQGVSESRQAMLSQCLCLIRGDEVKSWRQWGGGLCTWAFSLHTMHMYKSSKRGNMSSHAFIYIYISETCEIVHFSLHLHFTFTFLLIFT